MIVVGLGGVGSHAAHMLVSGPPGEGGIRSAMGVKRSSSLLLVLAVLVKEDGAPTQNRKSLFKQHGSLRYFDAFHIRACTRGRVSFVALRDAVWRAMTYLWPLAPREFLWVSHTPLAHRHQIYHGRS